jgi:Mg2+ and Co2+ transporter CorA
MDEFERAYRITEDDRRYLRELRKEQKELTERIKLAEKRLETSMNTFLDME